MTADFPAAIAIPGVTAAVIGVLRALRHDRAAIRDCRKVLAYNIGFKLLGVLGLVLLTYAALAPFIILMRDPSELVRHPAKVIAISLMSFIMAWVMSLLPIEILLRGFSYDEKGLYASDFLRGYRSATWADVALYRDNGINAPFLRLRDGRKIKVWKQRDGFPEFLGVLKMHQVPGSRDATAAV